jgi:uncharacterized protein YjdB
MRNRVTRSLVGLMTAVVAAIAMSSWSGAQASAAPRADAGEHAQSTAAGPRSSVCYRAHVQNIGWQNWVCNGDIAGTVGQALRLEALQIRQWGAGGFCAQAHVEGLGWQNARCGNDGGVVTVGTTGHSLRMEALSLSANSTVVCANAHVQNIGWQGVRCGRSLVVGTTGQALRMEAVTVFFP